MSATQIDKVIEQLGILVVDPNAYMRKLTRSMLMTIGAKAVYEAGDGLAALDVIRAANPDVLLLDWDLPALSGPQVMRIIRAPAVFPKPNLPIIMLTSCANRAQVHEAMLLGVHEFLLKPTSPQALRDRLTSILVKPRAMLQIGKYYVPAPRRPIAQNEMRRAA
jgi:two-component system, chemotaxis family, chemotaxis protein CheY